MSRNVRVIVVNTDEEVGPDLRAVLLANEGVKIVAEIDEPALLSQAIDQFPAEVLLVHLDPNPAGMMDVIAPLLESRKGQLAAIGMTEDRDAELVMRAMRAGMKELLWKPFPPEQLAEILARLAHEAPDGGRRLGRVVAVVGSVGGVGATQLACNLAVEMAQLSDWAGDRANSSGHPKVVAVDLDLRFGQVAMQLDVQPTYTIAELCETPEHIDAQMIERAMQKHPTGVHILARPNDFQQSERISAGQAASVVAALQEHYDFVVIDVAARFDPTARAVFDMADTLLPTVQLMVPSVRNADRMLHELLSTGYSDDRIRLVCNRYSTDAGYLEQTDVETTLKRKFSFLLPDDWKTSSAAINIGAPLYLHAPKSRLRLAYRQMAQSLAGVNENGEGREKKSESNGNGERRGGGLFKFFAGAK